MIDCVGARNPYAVAAVSFGSVASVQGATEAPNGAFAMSTYFCGDDDAIRVPVTTTR